MRRAVRTLCVGQEQAGARTALGARATHLPAVCVCRAWVGAWEAARTTPVGWAAVLCGSVHGLFGLASMRCNHAVEKQCPSPAMAEVLCQHEPGCTPYFARSITTTAHRAPHPLPDRRQLAEDITTCKQPPSALPPPALACATQTLSTQAVNLPPRFAHPSQPCLPCRSASPTLFWRARARARA